MWSISEPNQFLIFVVAQVRRGDLGAHGWTDTTHTHIQAVTTKLLKYTYTHTYCNTIIYLLSTIALKQ